MNLAQLRADRENKVLLGPVTIDGLLSYAERLEAQLIVASAFVVCGLQLDNPSLNSDAIQLLTNIRKVLDK